MYKPLWMRLADAVACALAAGLTEAEAQDQIARAISDGQIKVRVQIDASERDMAGQSRGKGEIVPPLRLSTSDLDWLRSAPLAPWSVVLTPAENYNDLDTRPRRIALLELWSANVTSIFGREDVPAKTPSRPAGRNQKAKATPGKPKRKPGPPPSTSSRIIAAMVKDYHGNPEGLRSEKRLTLAKKYGVVESTIDGARDAALSQMSNADE